MGENLTVGKLIKKILIASKRSPNYPIKIAKNTIGDSFGFRSSNLKLMKIFKYKPRYKLDRGLKEYFNWIDKIPVKKNLKPYHPLKK